MTEAIYAVAGSLATVLIIYIINTLRTASSLPRRVKRLEAVSALSVETLDVQTEGLIAIAEAVSGEKCNGNVKDALASMRENKKKTRSFLAENVTGGAR
jgi:hypothetical protein